MGQITTLRILRWDVLYQEYGTHEKTAQTNSPPMKPHPFPRKHITSKKPKHTFTSMNAHSWGKVGYKGIFSRSLTLPYPKRLWFPSYLCDSSTVSVCPTLLQCVICTPGALSAILTAKAVTRSTWYGPTHCAASRLFSSVTGLSESPYPVVHL